MDRLITIFLVIFTMTAPNAAEDTRIKTTGSFTRSEGTLSFIDSLDGGIHYVIDSLSGQVGWSQPAGGGPGKVAEADTWNLAPVSSF
ncbi:MAG: hypothetical protein ABGZ17_18275 [Planctomycetaceae bacterium]